MIRILIADDDDFILTAISSYLNLDSTLKVVGTAKRGEEALSLIEKLEPDVVLVDIEMPGQLNGLDVSRITSQSFPKTKVLMLTSHSEELYIKKALDTGAKGYLLKSTTANDLINSVKYVHKGYSQLSPGILEKLWGGKTQSNHSLATLSPSTKLNGQQSIPAVNLDEFLPSQQGSFEIFGLSFTAIGVGIIFLSSVLSFNMAVKVPVQIRPKGELKSIEATTSGIVNNISIDENETVKSGDIIATVRATELLNKKSELEVQIDKSNDQIDSTNLKIDSIDKQINAQQQALEQKVAALQANLDVAEREYQDKKVETDADLEASDAEVALATEELTRFKSLAATGAVSKLQISEKTAKLKNRIAQRKKSEVALNPTQGEIARINSEIEAAKAQKTQNISAVRREKYSLEIELVELLKNKSKAQQELASVEERLSRNVIRTPISGTIQRLFLRNQNQVVERGDVVATLSANDLVLRAEAYMPSKDRSLVKPEQLVKLKIDSCPYPDYGTAKGRVESVSPDVIVQSSLENEPGKNQQVSNLASYKVIISLSERSLQKKTSEKCLIKAGMEGKAEIITKRETVLKFLLRKARLLADI